MIKKNNVFESWLCQKLSAVMVFAENSLYLYFYKKLIEENVSNMYVVSEEFIKSIRLKKYR